MCKVKGIPRQVKVALGVPGRLRLRIFSTFGTTRVVGRQPNAPAAFTPGEIPGTHFQKYYLYRMITEIKKNNIYKNYLLYFALAIILVTTLTV